MKSNEWEKDVREFITAEFKQCVMDFFQKTADEWVETVIEPDLRDSCGKYSDELEMLHPYIEELAGGPDDMKMSFERNMRLWCEDMKPAMDRFFNNLSLTWKVNVQDITNASLPVYLMMLKSFLHGIAMVDESKGHKNKCLQKERKCPK